MGGTGSGRPKKANEDKVNKIYTGVYISPEAYEALKTGAFRLNCKYSHYMEFLLKSDQALTLQLLASELLGTRLEIEDSILNMESELTRQKALLDKVNKLIKRLGR